MRVPVATALFLTAAPCLLGQSWTTFYSAYEDGLAAQKQGDHAQAIRAFARAVSLEPNPGSRVKTYGLNFLPSYHPYLRIAESALALGDLTRADSALKDSVRFGKEPAGEREALLARLRQAQQAAAKPAPQPAPVVSVPAQAQPPPVQAQPAPPQPVPSAPAPASAPSVQPPRPVPIAVKSEKPPPAPAKPEPTVEKPAAATPAPSPVPVPAAAAPPVAAVPVSSSASRTPLWIGLGALALLAGTAALLLGRTRGRRPRKPAQGTNPYQLDFESLEGATMVSPKRDEDDPNVNRAFGPYTTHKVLGRGGCATAYFGTHRETGAEVAIKVPHRHIAADDEFLARFRRESALGALLEHPRIVRIVDPGPREGDPWLAMHFVRGTTLESWLRTHPSLPIPQIIHIASDIAEAIAYAHTKGVVHRDLKPANIMIGETGAVVMDFGIARVLDTTMTSTTMFIGTPTYSAPESIVNPRVGPPADRYALGIILFEMLAGRPPFGGDTTFQILDAQRNQPLPDLSALRPDTPPRLLRLVQRLCAKHAEERPEDGETQTILAGLKVEFPLET
jgi:outer membrane biosynthesis protein TonB